MWLNTSMNKFQIAIFMSKTEIILCNYYIATGLDQGLVHGERRCRSWSVAIQFCCAARSWITHDFGRVPRTRICSIVLGIVQAPQHACDCISCSKSGQNSQPKQTNYTHLSWRAKYNVKHQSSSSGHMKVHENVVRITSCIANII
jgi:hypothetical protein